MATNNNQYGNAALELGRVIKINCMSRQDATKVKQLVRDSYTQWGDILYQKNFLNWGLYDARIKTEFCSKFPTKEEGLKKYPDTNSACLAYYLVRILVQKKFFGKSLLDIGCGTGIGLRLYSELLKTNLSYALDLSDSLIHTADKEFKDLSHAYAIQGDAENIPLKNNSIDVITNLESSHLYPQPVCFFEEIYRVLRKGGYFCYADIHVPEKSQSKTLKQFVSKNKSLKIVKKKNITRMVQRSIYDRLVLREESFCKIVFDLCKKNKERYQLELPYYALAQGINFLPLHWALPKNPILNAVGRESLEVNYWGKKQFFYYLIQKE